MKHPGASASSKRAPAKAGAVSRTGSPQPRGAVDDRNVWQVLRSDALWPLAVAWLRAQAIGRLARQLDDPNDATVLSENDDIAWKAGSWFASGWRNATPSEQSAGKLLMCCVEFVRHGNKGEGWRSTLQKAYSGMAADAVAKGNKFPPGRVRGALGPVGKLVHELAPEVDNFAELVGRLEKLAACRERGVFEVDTESETVVIFDQYVTFKTLKNQLSIAKNPDKR